MKPNCMRILIVGFILVGILSMGRLAHAAMSSSNYLIEWDTISQGGSDTSGSVTYQLRDSLGNAGVGNSSSTSYDLRAGYRQGVFDQIITFDLFGQETTSGREATGLVGTTITADSTGINEGDFIVLIQDEGVSQVSAIGQVVSVGGTTITVDVLKDGGVAPTIDGTNDQVYLLDSGSVDLGELTDTAVTTAVIGFNTTIDVDQGYVVQVFDDGDLRDGADTVNDVGDGSVTAGNEEYGGRSSDSTLPGSTFDTIDTGFTTTFQPVADETETSFESRNFVTLKASVASGTADGTYGHVLSFIVSGNF